MTTQAICVCPRHNHFHEPGIVGCIYSRASRPPYAEPPAVAAERVFPCPTCQSMNADDCARQDCPESFTSAEPLDMDPHVRCREVIAKLRGYSAHRSSCPHVWGEGLSCTCGLDALLAELAKGEK